MRWWKLSVLLCLLSCDSDVSVQLIPADAELFTDGSQAWSCTESTNLQSNFNHCGACGLQCSSADADTCIEGLCRCGSELACSSGSDCREGRCISVDPEGAYCEFDRECLTGFACIEGHCSFVTCIDEACDGYDNDCDSRVDEGAPGSPLSRYCLGDGPIPETPILLPCEQGVQLCVGGAWTECAGDIPPVPESGFLACDGIDNDCNGCVDGELDPETLVCTFHPASLFDVVFVIDVSDSMAGSIDIVTAAVGLFAGRLASSNMQYGVVTIPGNETAAPSVLQDLASLETLRTTLGAISVRGGTEPQLDAVYGLGTGDLEISWREDAVRIIIVFTDEAAQTLLDITEQDMCDALSSGEVLIVVAPLVYARGLGAGPDPVACAWDTLLLPTGRPGSGDLCRVNRDCDGSGSAELCFEGQCFTETVQTTVIGLESVITDPCAN